MKKIYIVPSAKEIKISIENRILAGSNPDGLANNMSDDATTPDNSDCNLGKDDSNDWGW